MADRVPKITQEQKPTFDAAIYSDRLQETRQAAGPLAPVQVFDKTKPSSIVPLAKYVAGKLTDTTNALTDFTADLKGDVDEHADRLATHTTRLNALDARLDAIEAAAPPFPGA